MFLPDVYVQTELEVVTVASVKNETDGFRLASQR